MVSIALVLWLLAPSAQATPAPVNDAARRQVEALEHRWLASENDPAALDDILADDFLHVVPQGIITKNEQLTFMRAHPASNDGSTRRFEELRVRVFGTAAIATGIVAATATDGTTRKTAFTDVFAYRSGRWRAVNAQETPLTRP
jgi:ketosteroid isomerase-like protein